MPLSRINTSSIANNTIIAADINANTITGDKLVANTLANSVFQTGSVENYSRAVGLLGMRNRIINGAMVIDQRNAGASVATSSGTEVYSLDRWKGYYSATSKFTIQQNAGSVTPPAGFTNYLGVTSTSAYSVSSTDYFAISQPIEGYNVADLNWGSANAKTVTLSFWVRSSLTGTFGGSIDNSAVNRSYPFTYTISAANTWEQKSVTIAGETSGTWLTTNGTGLYLLLGLGAGSSVSGTAGVWASTLYWSATGATSIVGTNGATFYITGVQLEVGSSATGFEYRQYGQELALCQRYCYKVGGQNSYERMSTYGAFTSTTNAQIYVQAPTSMRTTPTVTGSTLAIYDGSNVFSITAVNLTGTAAGLTIAAMDMTIASGGTANRPCQLLANASTSAYFIMSAEL